MKTSLPSNLVLPLVQKLKTSHHKFSIRYTGNIPERTPIHVVYGGAHLFSADTAQKCGHLAMKSLQENAPDSVFLMKALGQENADRHLWARVYDRVIKKLEQQPVEDFRIDFEDGYGIRPESEEDAHAEKAAWEVSQGMVRGTLPPRLGIRIKSFSEESYLRSFRTLDIFISTLLAQTGGKLPSQFVITLPKVTQVEQCETLVGLLELLEKIHQLSPGLLKYELMVEAPQAILDVDGRCPLRRFVEVGHGRCVGAHFGTYDYSAGCGLAGHSQSMRNPVCDFAKHMMQVSLIGTGVWLSDGATHVMPVGPHRAGEGKVLLRHQLEENQSRVHRSWRLSYDHIRHSLTTGFYQGWDLHPAQLPIRYAATYAFFLEGLEQVTDRLQGFVQKATRATLCGGVFDDAATGQGLLNFFLLGLSCGAITQEEVLKTGLSIEDIQTRSFLKILERQSQEP
jgi:hypothetical protein